MYTVIQNSTTSTPTCQNVTAPTTLQVQATVPGGPMSQYGFIDQVIWILFFFSIAIENIQVHRRDHYSKVRKATVHIDRA